MASIQGIYIALFGRPVDPAGLAYWEGETKDGTDLSGLVGRLTESPEYLDRFQGNTNEQVINALYQELFGRSADAAGSAFFLDALNSGTQTIETIAISMLDGARNADTTVIANKIEAADHFTASLDTPAEIAAYSGDAASRAGHAFLETVTGDPATVPSQGDVDTAIGQIVDPVPPVGPTPPVDPTPPAPVFTVEHSYGDIDATVGGTLYAGMGNPSYSFSKAVVDGDIHLELGLTVRYGDTPGPLQASFDFISNTTFTAQARPDVELVYSVAGDIDLSKFDFKLTVDTDPGIGEAWKTFTLVPDGTVSITGVGNVSDSAYDWVSGGDVIGNDGGTDTVTQGIHTYTSFGAPQLADGNHYDVTLAVYFKDTDTLVADASATIVGVPLPPVIIGPGI